MADVITKTRTDYFGCSDIAGLRDLIRSLKTDGGPVTLVEDGGKCMFYCEGEIEGCLTPMAIENMESDPDWADDNPEQAYSHELFLERLQGMIAPGQGCVMTCIGYEAMRQIWSDAYIVTRSLIHRIDFNAGVNAILDEMLGLESDDGPKIRMKPVLPTRDICSCSMCGAKNFGDGAVTVYDVKFERQVIRLCEKCARELHGVIGETLRL